MDEKQKKMLEDLLFEKNRKPTSMGKSLFYGRLETRHLLPYPEPDPAAEKAVDALLVQLRDFCDRAIDAERIDEEENIPETVIRGLASLGILGLSIPEKFGGLGWTQYGYCRVMELLASHCGSTGLLVNAHQSVGLKALLLFGTEEQKARWLGPLARGEILAAFSLTEPNAGSDASGLETKAEYDPVKCVYRINGRKQWTTNGSLAGFLTVMAKTEDGGITAFIVTPDMPGFRIVDPALRKVGYRGTRTTNLAFENMEVPESNILGAKGKGLRICLTVLDFGRTTFGATCTGCAKYLMQRAQAHAIERRQFGQALAAFPLVKQKLAEMAALVYAMDASTYLTASLIDEGQDDIMLETAILKVFASDSLWKILYDTMQIFGGRSFFRTEPFERMMRDARINMIGEGSNDVLRVFIAAVGLREVGVAYKSLLESMKHPASAASACAEIMRSLFRSVSKPSIPVRSSRLAPETERLRRSIRRFSLSVLRLLLTYREAVAEDQLKLNRIAEGAISLYTTAAVLSKIDSRLQSGAPADAEVDTARLYCTLALDRLEVSLDHLRVRNRDSDLEALSDRLTGHRPS